MNKQPLSIDILSVRLEEPVTVLTDILIAGVCFYAFFRLNRMSGKKDLLRWLKLYFLFLGTGTFMGALLGHGFGYDIPHFWKLPGWFASMIAVAFIGQASTLILAPRVPLNTVRLFQSLNVVTLLVFLVLVAFTHNFLFVTLYIALVLIALVGRIHLRIYLASGERGSLWFMRALAVALAGGLIYLSGWKPGGWISAMDISHTLLAVAAYFFYLGARTYTRETPGAGTS